ncbi:SUMO-specific isopeptidase USPL1 [Orycteropus afer afer]|uniref:SUMO-specific isopeptidase USPL1 n=1 Tax=Orycteropus afer afer TaxID=1230840 RepID=A0A8B7B777_ORYAF|nr:SUMO-specific isopeptidase USPL1 [Orycteropus afer afer]
MDRHDGHHGLQPGDREDGAGLDNVPSVAHRVRAAAGGGGAVQGERGVNVALGAVGPTLEQEFGSIRCGEGECLRQCIYPLGSKSLAHLLSPDPEDCHTPNKPRKRKVSAASCEDSPPLADSKRAKHHIVTGGERPLSRELGGEGSDGASSGSPASPRGGPQVPGGTADAVQRLQAAVGDSAGEDAAADVSGTRGTAPESEGRALELELPSERSSLSFGPTACVQWKNAYSLCWLDCILSTLVHLEGLRTAVAKLDSKEESIFWRLLTKYEEANGLLSASQLDGGSWLECDDLKGPCAERREKLEVPASEIHIVIWERKASPVIDEAAASFPLRKTNDQCASGRQEPVFPAPCSVGSTPSAAGPPVTRPPDPAALSTALPQEATAVRDCVLPDPQALGDSNVLPLTLEEMPVDPGGFPLEGKPVTGNNGGVETDALPSQDPLTDVLMSPPRTEKLIQGHVADVRFASQVTQASMPAAQLNTGGALVTEPASSGRAADLTQGAQSVKTESTPQLRPLLSPKTERLKPEQHAKSQVPDSKKKQAATCWPGPATRSAPAPAPSLTANEKKPFVGSWVKGLLSKGASFMPPCVSAHTRNSVADLQPSAKGANNFGGFKTKGANHRANRASRKSRKNASKPPLVRDPPPSRVSSDSPASRLLADGNAISQVLKTRENTSPRAPLSDASPGAWNGVPSGSLGDSVDGQVHQLRLKLLKKLKAKKRKLAALMASPQHGTLPSENGEDASHCGSPSDSESIEHLLRELQHQIDIADARRGCAAVPGTPPCGGQTQEDILAELLSPAAVVPPGLSEPGEAADFRDLEAGAPPSPAPAPSGLSSVPQDTHPSWEHDYCSPTKKSQGEVQADSPTDSSCLRTLSLENSIKTDLFDEFFSTSALNSFTNDSLDLPHFDEYLFESC